MALTACVPHLTTARLNPSHKQQLSHKEARTELDVNVVPHTPERPVHTTTLTALDHDIVCMHFVPEGYEGKDCKEKGHKRNTDTNYSDDL